MTSDGDLAKRLTEILKRDPASLQNAIAQAAPARSQTKRTNVIRSRKTRGRVSSSNLKIKYAYTRVESGEIAVYVGGHIQRSVRAFALPEGYSVLALSLDNLGGANYAIDLAYSKNGSDAYICRYIGRQKRWEVQVQKPFQVRDGNPTKNFFFHPNGYGFWTREYSYIFDPDLAALNISSAELLTGQRRYYATADYVYNGAQGSQVYPYVDGSYSGTGQDLDGTSTLTIKRWVAPGLLRNIRQDVRVYSNVGNFPVYPPGHVFQTGDVLSDVTVTESVSGTRTPYAQSQLRGFDESISPSGLDLKSAENTLFLAQTFTFSRSTSTLTVFGLPIEESTASAQSASEQKGFISRPRGGPGEEILTGSVASISDAVYSPSGGLLNPLVVTDFSVSDENKLLLTGTEDEPLIFGNMLPSGNTAVFVDALEGDRRIYSDVFDGNSARVFLDLKILTKRFEFSGLQRAYFMRPSHPISEIAVYNFSYNPA